jgi:hypothetical protein
MTRQGKGKQKVDAKLFALRQNRECCRLRGLGTVDKSFHLTEKVHPLKLS